MKNIQKHEKSLPFLGNIRYVMPGLAIMALLLLAACGGGSTPTTGSSTPTTATGSTPTAAPTIAVSTPTTTLSDTCSLVTAAQAGTILGGTVQTRSTTETFGTSQATGCGYASSTGGSASFAVVVSGDSTIANTAFTQLQQVTQTTSGSKYQVVSGLGDAAFTNGTVLYVLKGKTIMIITVTTSDSSKVLPDEKLFAQAALPKVS